MNWESLNNQQCGELQNFSWGQLHFCDYPNLFSPQNLSLPLPDEAKSSAENLRNKLSSKNSAYSKILNFLGINTIKDFLEFIIVCKEMYASVCDADLIDKLRQICTAINEMI